MKRTLATLIIGLCLWFKRAEVLHIKEDRTRRLREAAEEYARMPFS